MISKARCIEGRQLSSKTLRAKRGQFAAGPHSRNRSFFSKATQPMSRAEGEEINQLAGMKSVGLVAVRWKEAPSTALNPEGGVTLGANERKGTRKVDADESGQPGQEQTVPSSPGSS